MSRRLEGQVALVTGASRGIGRAIAVELAREGANVALAARNRARLLVVQREIAAVGGQASAFAADVGSEEDAAALVQDTIQRFGQLDILVNNAGIGLFGPLAQTSTADWDRLMATNARGAFLCCRQAIPHLRQREVSFIVNIASVVGHKGYANQSAYSASKHAIGGMSKALAKEVQADNIRVHVVCPGGVDTDMVGDARPDLDRSSLMAPQDVADVVLFLVTRRSNAVIDQVNMRRASSTPFA